MTFNIEDGCIGCGQCVGTCPSVFRMRDEGIAEVYARPDTLEETAAREAADNCPVNVITSKN